METVFDYNRDSYSSSLDEVHAGYDRLVNELVTPAAVLDFLNFALQRKQEGNAHEFDWAINVVKQAPISLQAIAKLASAELAYELQPHLSGAATRPSNGFYFTDRDLTTRYGKDWHKYSNTGKARAYRAQLRLTLFERLRLRRFVRTIFN